MYTPDSTSSIRGPSNPQSPLRKRDTKPNAFEKVMAKDQKERKMPQQEKLAEKKEANKQKSLFDAQFAEAEALSLQEEGDQEAHPSLFDLTKQSTSPVLQEDVPLTDAEETGNILSQSAQGNILDSKSTKTSTSADTRISKNEAYTEEKPLSPFELASRKPKIQKPIDEDVQVAALQPLDSAPRDISDTVKPKVEVPKTVYLEESSDLSYVNPLGPPPSIANQGIEVKVEAPKQAMSQADIEAIITQMVDAISTVNLDQTTETTITLKQPPLFEGATITIKTFESAPHELNITFSNLTQQAQALLDLKLNQEVLRRSLDDQGLAVHIITTTTLNEQVATIAEEHNLCHRDDEDQSEQQQQQQDQEEEEEK